MVCGEGEEWAALQHLNLSVVMPLVIPSMVLLGRQGVNSTVPGRLQRAWACAPSPSPLQPIQPIQPIQAILPSLPSPTGISTSVGVGGLVGAEAEAGSETVHGHAPTPLDGAHPAAAAAPPPPLSIQTQPQTQSDPTSASNSNSSSSSSSNNSNSIGGVGVGTGDGQYGIGDGSLYRCNEHVSVDYKLRRSNGGGIPTLAIRPRLTFR